MKLHQVNLNEVAGDSEGHSRFGYSVALALLVRSRDVCTVFMSKHAGLMLILSEDEAALPSDCTPKTKAESLDIINAAMLSDTTYLNAIPAIDGIREEITPDQLKASVLGTFHKMTSEVLD